MGVSAIVGRSKKDAGRAVIQTSLPAPELGGSRRASADRDDVSPDMAGTHSALSAPVGNGVAPTEPDMLGATHASAVWGTAPAQIGSCASQRARHST